MNKSCDMKYGTLSIYAPTCKLVIQPILARTFHEHIHDESCSFYHEKCLVKCYLQQSHYHKDTEPFMSCFQVLTSNLNGFHH